MRTQLFKTLIAIAVASTLTACASKSDTSADTAAADASMSSPSSTVSPGTRHQQMTGGSMAGTSSRPEPYPSSTLATGNIQPRASDMPVTASAPAPMPQQADTSVTQAAPTTASTQMDTSQAHASTMSGQTVMDSEISPAGAMKTEVVEGSQMGASTGGMTAASMDQQAVCSMYARLKSAASTEEREKVMTEILLNVPRGDSALVDVGEQCASSSS